MTASIKLRVCVLTIVILLTIPVSARGQLALWLVEKRLDLKYDVPDVTYVELKKRLSSEGASKYMIFDTRQKEEYETSHIQSAIYIAPDMSADAFMKQYGSRIRGKHLVFYCSVGDRSSHFIERVREKALEKGAMSLSNLRGGIFRWYNEKNTVVNENGETDAVHPYDEEWGKLIIKREGR
ncbi:MAG: rhodanese-like domain-containing protein [Deltaproteobacteria bacterium]|nr:rhodanese-like domain-containing protein [Deltaproteobacteria bacterium]